MASLETIIFRDIPGQHAQTAPATGRGSTYFELSHVQAPYCRKQAGSVYMRPSLPIKSRYRWGSGGVRHPHGCRGFRGTLLTVIVSHLCHSRTHSAWLRSMNDVMPHADQSCINALQRRQNMLHDTSANSRARGVLLNPLQCGNFTNFPVDQ